MMEPNYADIDGLFCRRGNRDRGGRRWSWWWLSGCEHYPPTFTDSVKAGTQDVGGADTRLDGTSGAGAACGCDESRDGTGTAANAATAANTTAAAANRGGSAISE